MILLVACTPVVPVLGPAPPAPPLDTGTPATRIPPDTAAPPGIDMTPPPDGPLPVIRVSVRGRIQEDVDTAGTLDVILQHDAALDDLDTAPIAWTGNLTIEIRGSSSAGFDKHSYGIELQDQTGAETEVPLLGLPQESDWVFYGPYDDKTYLRDAFTYEIARQMGDYAPRTSYFELYLNRQYQGLYQLTEKIKRDNHRVDVPAPAASAAEGDITGGYLFKREDSGEPDGWYSAAGNYYNYQDPSAAQITAAQARYLQGWVDDFEGSFQAGSDPVQGFPAYMDVSSFVDFALSQELSRNVDGYRKSAYFYKKADSDGGLLYAGPLWDFNIAYGNADYCDGWVVEGMVRDGRADCSDLDSIPAWWDTLWADPAFTDPARCRWNTLRKTLLSDDSMFQTLATLGALLPDAEKRDHQKWPVIGEKLWPNYYVGQSYADEVDYLKSWLQQRAAWLDGNLPGQCP